MAGAWFAYQVSPADDAVLLRFRCRGHPAIRATHAKTFEFTGGAGISERATCVIGVGLRWEIAPAPVIAGPVRLGLDLGGESVTVRARANPGWQPDRGMVVRRSANRLPDTLATDADLSAADLPRGLLTALRDPAREFTVTVERSHPAAARATLLLLATAGDPERMPRLLAESAAADVIVAEDTAASGLLRGQAVSTPVIPLTAGGGERGGRPRVPGRPPGPAGAPGPAATLGPAISAGQRVLVVACEALPGRSVLGWLDPPGGLDIEVAGLPAALSVAAASPSRAPVLLLDGARPRDLRSLVRNAPPATRLVLRTRAADLPGLCRAAGGGRPTAAVTVVRAAPQHAERVLRRSPAELAEAVPAHETVLCCLDAAAGPGGPGDDVLGRLLAALAREQVPARTLAAALSATPGWSRNRAHAFVNAVMNQPAAER